MINFNIIFSLLFFAIFIVIIVNKFIKQKNKAPVLAASQFFTTSVVSEFKFNDIAGNIEAKESVNDIIEFIKNPTKFEKYGAKMPKGIIFYGQPGTGKTLMAKAIAGEAGVDFYSLSGSDFVQMYVGVGASRIRDLFKLARKKGKAVIFIDEIDSIGKKRGNQSSGGSDEREQTLNALLTEMSGFSSKDGIIVIAATNRLDILDDALLRPGRFDRQIEISLPDISAREQIINLYFKNKPISTTVDLKTLSKQTVYFSGAMLENLVNEAAIFAAKSDSTYIEMEHFDKAFYTIIAGSEKVERTHIKEHEKKITAFHESGHVLATKILMPENIVSKVTIIPSTKGAGGFCVNIPPDKLFYSKEEIEHQIMINLAGRAAEETFFGLNRITTGASNDIEKATSLAIDYVSKFGMDSDFGLANGTILGCKEEISKQSKIVLNRLYEETKKLILINKNILEEIAFRLIEKESLNEEEIDLYFECQLDFKISG